MQTKHTRGPWSVQDTNSAKLSTVVVAAPGLNGSTVVIGQCAGPDKEANAHLIAAAPELLAALQGAIGALEFSQDYHRELGNEDQAFAADRLDAARAAIAKATAGETRNAEGAL